MPPARRRKANKAKANGHLRLGNLVKPFLACQGFEVKVIAPDDYIKRDSGLIYQDFEVGTGDCPKDCQQVTFHYVGYNESGRRIESTYLQGSPAKIRMGNNALAPGFEEGIKDMKAGGKRRIIIPPDHGSPRKSGICSSKPCTINHSQKDLPVSIFDSGACCYNFRTACHRWDSTIYLCPFSFFIYEISVIQQFPLFFHDVALQDMPPARRREANKAKANGHLRLGDLVNPSWPAKGLCMECSIAVSFSNIQCWQYHQ